MPPRGWYARYAEILTEFGYSRSGDEAAARKLDGLARRRPARSMLERQISARDAFVVGAGPSLGAGIRIMKKIPGPVRIVADSAVAELVRRKMRIDVVVSDLDGDESSLRYAARAGAIMVIHAHADNADRLEIARSFSRMVGTTQSRPVGRISNFGGFTDGDRCVFVAYAMRARSITLLGMDFGSKVGTHSMTPASDVALKRRKLRHARMLLEWIAPRISRSARLYTASGRVAGFKRATYADLARMFG